MKDHSEPVMVFTYGDRTIPLYLTAEWEGWVNDPEGVRALRSGELTEHSFIFIMWKDFFEGLRDSEHLPKFLLGLEAMGEQLIKQLPESSQS